MNWLGLLKRTLRPSDRDVPNYDTTAAEGLLSSSLCRETRLVAILTWICLLLTTLGLLQPIAGIFARVSNDYGEGWNAYWARAALTGAPLYPVSNPLVANNYPPLSFYINGYFGYLVGDNIFAGRVIALLALITVTIIIGRIVYLLGSPRRWAWVTSLVFITFATVNFHEFVAVNNPQWLGQAVALIGLFLIVRVEPSVLRLRAVVVAAATMVVAGLIKHNQFALPLAVTIWLYRYNRRAFGWWCISGAILTAATVAFLIVQYHGSIFTEVVGFKRTNDWQNLLDGLISTAGFSGLIAVAIASIRPLKSDPRSVLLLLFALIGTLSGIVQRLGAGVFLNAHFDGLIGVVLVCGTLWGRSTVGALCGTYDARERSHWLLLALSPLLILSPLTTERAIARTFAISRQEATWAIMISRVRTARGPAICEMLAVCYWAGRPMGIDAFAYGQKLRTGSDPRPLERMISSRKIAVLIVDRNKHYFRGTGRLPNPLPLLIDKNYRVVVIAKRDIALMVPRQNPGN